MQGLLAVLFREDEMSPGDYFFIIATACSTAIFIVVNVI
jgi:hypothetical protein